MTSFPDLSSKDELLFNRVLIDEGLQFQTVFALYTSGQLEQSPYDTYLTWFACILATPGGQAWWKVSGRPFFEPEMVNAVDDRLHVGGLPDIRELPSFQPDETLAV